jgi:hypothetical protein
MVLGVILIRGTAVKPDLATQIDLNPFFHVSRVCYDTTDTPGSIFLSYRGWPTMVAGSVSKTERT